MTRHVTACKTPHVNRKITFNARSIGRIKPEATSVDWFDIDTKGLALRVTPAGSRTWYLFYAVGRTSRRVKLGTWPSMGLADARISARDTRVRIDRDGADPAHERRDTRTAFTVGELTDLFVKHNEQAQKRTWKDDQWRIKKYLLPSWKSRPVASITRADAHAVLDKIAADGKPIQANRVQALISKLWNFAIDRQHAETNPCHRMEKRGRETARTVVLDNPSLKALWRALDANPGDATDAVRLRLLTGQRGGEVHRMEWTHVDLDRAVWLIPATHAKNNLAHSVPLSPSALAILSARFAARVGKELRVFPGLYHQRKNLRALAAIHQGAYQWHDLRRVVTTRLAGLGFDDTVIGRVLNHAKRGVTATHYNVHTYDKEKRAALDAWAAELARIVSDEETAVSAVVTAT